MQLYFGMPLFFFGIWTWLHAPQGFWDYIIRCGCLSSAFFLILHATLHSRRLTSGERMVCLALFVLLAILAPMSILDAAQVRAFSNR